MSFQNNPSSLSRRFLCLGLLSFGLLALASFSLPSSAQTAAPQSELPGKSYAIVVPNYATLAPNKIIPMTEDIDKQQEAVKVDLFSQLSQGGLSDDAKAQVMYLMGDLRVYQAVYLLIQNIDFRHFVPSADGKPIFSTRIYAAAGEGYVARDALLEMGNTSLYAILEVIGSRSKDTPFDPARVNGYCWTLNALRGKTFATQQLQQQLALAKDPKVQAQYRSVLDRLKAYPPD